MNAAAVPTAAWQLSVAMRTASQKEHDAAEQSPFVGALLRGELGKEAYAAYLTQLRTIYVALETAVRNHRHDPVVGAVYDPALERVTAIDKDLEFWDDGSTAESNWSAADTYRRRLENIDSGVGLLAHHYTRYLGDLSGGQAIGRTLDRVFGLNGRGLAFYAFGVRPKRYKDAYRARLDALPLAAQQIEDVLAEVKSAFVLNQAVLDELGDRFARVARER